MPATKQLEILQEAKRNDVFIVSVSDETSKTISNYLKKNPIRLAVLADYPANSMINFFKVQSRPYSVLLNLNGEVLYKGHPSDITTSMIEAYASRERSKPKKNWDDLFVTGQNKAPKNVNVSSPTSIDDKRLFIARQPQTGQSMYFSNGIFYYAGPLSGLVKYLTDCSNYQIILQGINDYGVTMNCSQAELLNSKSNILQLIQDRLSLNIQIESKLTEAYILEVVNPKLLWDDKQINWGRSSSSNYIVGTDRIEADNLTLKEIAGILSDVKGNLYYYNGNDNNLYDWSFHYRYDNLMTEDLESNFGIVVKRGTIDLPIYVLSSQ